VRGFLLQGGFWGLWLGLSPLILFAAAPPRMPVYLYGEVDTRLETPGSKLVTMALIVLGLLPALLTIVAQRFRPAQALPIATLAMLVLSVISISLLGSDQVSDILKPALGAFVFLLAFVLVSGETRTETFIHNLLIGYALMHAGASLIALADHNFLWGRFMGRLGPNFWGAVCAYGLLAATVTDRRWLFVSIAAIDLLVLLLAQNRSAELALAVGGLFLILVFYNWSTLSGRLWMWLAGVAGGIAVMALLPVIIDKVLMINDPRRGLDSGATGREAAWAQALQVFEKHPLLGVGYRHHEDYITAASSAHQAYLATAADMGVIGLLLYLAFLTTGICAGMYKALVHRSKAYAALTAIMLGYAAHGMFEQRALNFANSISLMVIFAVALATKVELEPRLTPLRVVGDA
jgi:O-antigen ligase